MELSASWSVRRMEMPGDYDYFNPHIWRVLTKNEAKCGCAQSHGADTTFPWACTADEKMGRDLQPRQFEHKFTAG